MSSNLSLGFLHTAQKFCPNIAPVGAAPSWPTWNQFPLKESFFKKKAKQKIFVKDVVFSPEAKWLKQQASWAYSPLSLGHVRLLETLCQSLCKTGMKCQVFCKCQHSHPCYNYFLPFFLFYPNHSPAKLLLALSLLPALSSIDSLDASPSSTGTRHKEPLQPFERAQDPLVGKKRNSPKQKKPQQ